MAKWATEDVRIAAREGAVAMGMLFVDEKPAARDEAVVSFDRWLAAHDAEVAANAVEDAATEANLAWVAYRPDGWGSNDSDNEALSAFLWALKWLRARAAAIGAEADHAGE